MATISNRFFISAIDDGSSIQGLLNSTLPLSQAWDGSAATPEWTNENGPVIYLTVMKGGNKEYPDIDAISWYYNEQKLEFDSSGNVTSPNALVGKFKKLSNYRQNNGDNEPYSPAIKILTNLASSSNTDIDIIKVTGFIEVSGSQVGFSAAREIRISSITAQQGYWGGIYAKDGRTNLTNDNPTIELYAKLYQSGSSQPFSSGYNVKWYKNDEIEPIDATIGTPRISSYNGFPSLIINKDNFVDAAIIRAEFRFTGSDEIKFAAYEVIDDLTDPEILWIQQHGDVGSNGRAVGLHKGESVTLDIWVATQDPTDINQYYNAFGVKLFKSNATEITDEIDGISNVVVVPTTTNTPYDVNFVGYRRLNIGENNKAFITLNYETVKANGSSITGIVIAKHVD